MAPPLPSATLFRVREAQRESETFSTPKTVPAAGFWVVGALTHTSFFALRVHVNFVPLTIAIWPDLLQVAFSFTAAEAAGETAVRPTLSIRIPIILPAAIAILQFLRAEGKCPRPY